MTCFSYISGSGCLFCLQLIYSTNDLKICCWPESPLLHLTLPSSHSCPFSTFKAPCSVREQHLAAYLTSNSHNKAGHVAAVSLQCYGRPYITQNVLLYKGDSTEYACKSQVNCSISPSVRGHYKMWDVLQTHYHSSQSLSPAAVNYKRTDIPSGSKA